MLLSIFLHLGIVTAVTKFSTENWAGEFADGSGVLQSIRAVKSSNFNFSPTDYFKYRNNPGNYHTGDITFSWRNQGQNQWIDEDSALQRNNSPQSTTHHHGSFLHSNFNNVFPDTAQYLKVSRDWLAKDGDLVLQATFQNIATSPVEIGAFGFPIEFNNMFTNRTADQVTKKCVFVDPYIGLGAGYLQVTRLTGKGPNMIVTPNNEASKFEAWNFLTEDGSKFPYYQTQVFEGNYAWQTLTKAFAEREWNSTDPWNVPTSVTLSKGQSISFSIRFGVAENVHDIESAVASKGIPVAIGLPGYVLPTDMDGHLYINSSHSIQSIKVEPAGALSLQKTSIPNRSLKAYKVKGAASAFGRARVSIKYTNSMTQTIHYFITRPTLETASKLGSFLFNEQFFNDSSDPFHRAPSIINYDSEAGQQLLQNDNVYLAGLSDEGGSGAFETASMKTYAHPIADEVAKLEAMATTTVFGWLEVPKGHQKYAVRRSLFFYQPDAVPGYQYDSNIIWDGSWNKSNSYDVWRTFNAPHVIALWYSLYRADRVVPGILKLKPRTWYLDMAYETIRVCTTQTAYGDPATYAANGLMGETLWPGVIQDLIAENRTNYANNLLKIMKGRENAWANMSNPFGSEMAWDSTGQQGVYTWARYFSNQALIDKTVNSIRGYMPTVAHWGWNGNARRYWDFIYAGKLRRIERMIHHYGSGMNSLPLLDSFKYYSDPSSSTSFHDLRVGYAGHMGPLTNIDAKGLASMAFHSFPETLKWDAFLSDYGPNYLGHVQGSATYLVEHPDYGWVSMGGNIQVHGSSVLVHPKDTLRKQVYIAPMGLWVNFDGGIISNYEYDASAKKISIRLIKDSGSNIASTLMFYNATLPLGARLTSGNPQQSTGGYKVPIPGRVDFSL